MPPMPLVQGGRAEHAVSECPGHGEFKLPIPLTRSHALNLHARPLAYRFALGLLATPPFVISGCMSLPSPESAGIRYETSPSPWPTDAVCINPERGAVVAKEVLMGATRTVVIAGGSHPISDAAWVTYAPTGFNQKNSDRHTLFVRSCFTRSPSAPPGCAGEACRRVVENDGYTWVELSRIAAVDCTPGPGSCDPAHVRPGQLAIVVTQKCHEMVFEGRALLLRGPRGEEAIMHATADGVPTPEVVLPPGWSLRQVDLVEPLVVRPFGGAGDCFYNVMRDAKTQSYHQIRYAGPTYP